MHEKLNEIKFLLEERGLVKFTDSEVDLFIQNWMPEGNADYQQEFFLMDFKRVLMDVIALSFK